MTPMQQQQAAFNKMTGLHPLMAQQNHPNGMAMTPQQQAAAMGQKMMGGQPAANNAPQPQMMVGPAQQQMLQNLGINNYNANQMMGNFNQDPQFMMNQMNPMSQMNQMNQMNQFGQMGQMMPQQKPFNNQMMQMGQMGQNIAPPGMVRLQQFDTMQVPSNATPQMMMNAQSHQMVQPNLASQIGQMSQNQMVQQAMQPVKQGGIFESMSQKPESAPINLTQIVNNSPAKQAPNNVHQMSLIPPAAAASSNLNQAQFSQETFVRSNSQNSNKTAENFPKPKSEGDKKLSQSSQQHLEMENPNSQNSVNQSSQETRNSQPTATTPDDRAHFMSEIRRLQYMIEPLKSLARLSEQHSGAQVKSSLIKRYLDALKNPESTTLTLAQMHKMENMLKSSNVSLALDSPTPSTPSKAALSAGAARDNLDANVAKFLTALKQQPERVLAALRHLPNSTLLVGPDSNSPTADLGAPLDVPPLLVPSAPGASCSRETVTRSLADPSVRAEILEREIANLPEYAEAACTISELKTKVLCKISNLYGVESDQEMCIEIPNNYPIEAPSWNFTSEGANDSIEKQIREILASGEVEQPTITLLLMIWY